MRSYQNVTASWPAILRWLPFLTLAVIFVALLGGSLAGTASAAQPTTAPAVQTATEGNCQPWTLVDTPNPRTHHRLLDVDALAPDDIWAVGEYYNVNGGTLGTTLAMHWNGTLWEIIPTPPIGGYLNGVDALSPNDVWAVGYCGGCAVPPLIMHWDGVQWTRIPTPDPGGSGYIELSDVVALAPNNVWAVGANDGRHSTVAMNWDGTAWSIVPTPNGGMFGDDNVLTSVAAVSPSDIWAVGYIYPKGGFPTTLSIHWNGAQWTRVTTPNPGNYFRQLYGVTALAPNDVWAVGSYSYNSGKTNIPLFLHWNGTTWQHVQSPEFGDYNVLRDVRAIAPNDIWAVGVTSACNFCSFETLTMHWNGAAWSLESSPNGFRGNSRLSGVTATGSGDVWAVGGTFNGGSPGYSDSLTMHKVCSLGTATATPTGPAPTSTPTRTRVPTYTTTPTRTVAATPTCSPGGLRILIVYADYQMPPATLRNELLAHPGVQAVDFYRADSTTPTLGQLLQYDVVVALANLTVYADPNTLGNRLADYQDAHGIVVAFHYSWDGSLREITGRWQSEGYSPFEQFGGRLYSTRTLGSYNAGHPLMQGVTNLSAFYRGNLVLKPGAEQVAAWSDGPPLIATKGRAVGVSAYVGDADGGWSGDFARIVVNAGLWLRVNSCSGTPAATSTAGQPSPTRTATVTRTQLATSTPGGPPYCTAPSFAPDTEYAVGNGPERAAVADFNEDGNPDLAVVNEGSANLSVLLGNGDGGFGQATTYELDVQPSGITVGDYNRDGNLDLAASGFGANMALILLGNGVGGFGTAATYGSGSLSAGLATADFNRDGSPDLVIADNGHDTMLVLLNNGSGGFGVGTQYDLDWIPTDIAVGDFNRDGNMDIAAPNSFSDNVSVLLGNGTGGFGATQNYNVGPNPRSITIGDFNGDGNPDFATSSGDTGNISVRLGNGAGGFGSVANYPAGNGSMSIGQGDFNGDGKLDLAVANVPGNVAVLLGNSTGGFGPLQNFSAGSGPIAVTVGDFNRDAKPDLAVTNQTGDNMSVLLNTCPLGPTPTNLPQATSTLTATATASATAAQPSPSATMAQAASTGTATSAASATAAQPSATMTQATSTGTPSTSTGTPSASTPTTVAGTGTVAASTSTRTSVSATSTPVACAITFTDVPSDHTFYPYVRCLACRAILGGYSDGTFRPGNDVTRGQLSKIVANAALMNEPVEGRTFEDVTSNHTFYLYIERMARRGVVGGYPCGGEGEPCGTENRPYFRSGANATRGQISKIVANAVGASDPLGEQRFEDVPPTHTFYDVVQRLSNRGVMGGYPCGGPGEPCGQGNKPYFRPNANATRGQVSKIVGNTFFPDCR